MEIKSGVAKLIDDSIITKTGDKEPRKYLGMSGIGEECDRKIWYQFNEPKNIVDWFKDDTWDANKPNKYKGSKETQAAKLERTFRLGDAVEDFIVGILKDAGLEVIEKDDKGEQFRFSDLDGKYSGGMDGVIRGLPESSAWHVLEIKSAKDSRWKTFVKEGYMSDSKYWGQIHSYMHYAKLDNALIIIFNKDTSELYFERVKLDKNLAKRLQLKARSILVATEYPARRYAKKTFFKCKFCNYADDCWDRDND